MRKALSLALLGAGCLMAVPAQGFRAGAARVEITPAADAALPMAGYGARVEPHKGVHDSLYVRALVLDDGERKAALVSCDIIFITNDLHARLTERIGRETGIAPDGLLIAATHTHGAPSLGPVKPEFEARWRPWRETLEQRAAEAVRKAAAVMQPARLAVGTGKAWVNTNRRARLASGGWGLGVNPEGPSDKTVGVIRIESVSGDLIGLVINYSVHGTVMGPRNYEITGDLPGVTARYVEEHFGDRVVALWTSGASGDQNAIYGPGTDFGRMTILGRILGEEVVKVAEQRLRTWTRVPLRTAQRVVTCPGRKLTADSKPEDNKIAFEDAEPVHIRLSLLQMGPVVLAGVSGEVLTEIGARLKRESPFSHTLMVTHANGSCCYIPDDAAYAQESYEIWISRLKPGCAENGIVNTFLEILEGQL